MLKKIKMVFAQRSGVRGLNDEAKAQRGSESGLLKRKDRLFNKRGQQDIQMKIPGSKIRVLRQNCLGQSQRPRKVGFFGRVGMGGKAGSVMVGAVGAGTAALAVETKAEAATKAAAAMIWIRMDKLLLI